MNTVTVGLFRAPSDMPNFSMDRYATSLAAELRKLNDERYQLEVIQPGPSSLPRALKPTPPARYWMKYLRYLAIARSTTCAINHVLDHAYGHLLYALDAPRTIVTCHDLFPILHWRGEIVGLPPRRKRPVSVELSVKALRRARFVVAVSEATKRDLVELVGVAAENVYVVHPGIDPVFEPHGAGAQRERWHSGESSESTLKVLFVDTGGPYKNRVGVLETFARVRTEMARSGARVQLIRIGPPLSSSERDVAQRLDVSHAVTELRSVSNRQMPLIYSTCDVLVSPSFYEGFGWPPLEAMACGLPVVISRAPALVEVAGPAAAIADAEDYDGLAECICRLLTDKEAWASARARGLAHAQSFSWNSAAEAISKLYEQILDEVRA